jgi:hypothetical protein
MLSRKDIGSTEHETIRHHKYKLKRHVVVGKDMDVNEHETIQHKITNIN